jgi:hypothetical protein
MCFFSQEKSIMLRFVTCLVVVLSVVAVANAGTITVNPASGNQTLYSYNALTDGETKFTADATSYAFGWTGNSDVGELYTWADNFNSAVIYHLQAAPGSTIASDVAVKYRVQLMDWVDGIPANAWYDASWSTNNTTWTSFGSVHNPTWNVDTTATTALAASGFAGGTDLYVRFTGWQGPGEHAYLFPTYKEDSVPNFVVTGTVTATPEPSTIVLIGTGLFGLLAYAWRKRK